MGPSLFLFSHSFSSLIFSLGHYQEIIENTAADLKLITNLVVVREKKWKKWDLSPVLAKVSAQNDCVFGVDVFVVVYVRVRAVKGVSTFRAESPA